MFCFPLEKNNRKGFPMGTYKQSKVIQKSIGCRHFPKAKMPWLFSKNRWICRGCSYGVCYEPEKGKWWKDCNKGERTGDCFEWRCSMHSYKDPRMKEMG